MDRHSDHSGVLFDLASNYGTSTPSCQATMARAQRSSYSNAYPPSSSSSSSSSTIPPIPPALPSLLSSTPTAAAPKRAKPIKKSTSTIKIPEGLRLMLDKRLSDGQSKDSVDVKNAISVITLVTMQIPDQQLQPDCQNKGTERFDIIFRVATEVNFFDLATPLHNNLSGYLKDIEISRRNFSSLIPSSSSSSFSSSSTTSQQQQQSYVKEGYGTQNIYAALTEIRVELWKHNPRGNNNRGISFTTLMDYGRGTEELELENANWLQEQDKGTIYALSRCIFNMERSMPAVKLFLELPSSCSTEEEVIQAESQYCVTFHGVESIRYNFGIQMLLSFQTIVLKLLIPMGEPRIRVWLRKLNAPLQTSTYVVQARHSSMQNLSNSLLCLPENAVNKLRKRKRAFEDVEPDHYYIQSSNKKSRSSSLIEKFAFWRK